MPNVLTVLSSSRSLSVYPDAARKRIAKHDTGYFLSELAVPARALEEAGYSLVYTSPSGHSSDSVPDPMSVARLWFASDEVFQDAVARFRSLEISLPLEAAKAADYAAVFLPGGHAPMEDLVDCEALGSFLVEMSCQGKPIGAICHGPAGLLSAGSFFSGRHVTCFSRAEEQQEEPGADNFLGGYVPFYLDESLEESGLEVSARLPWKPHVVGDGNLVTGQNPMSDQKFAESFIQLLEKNP